MPQQPETISKQSSEVRTIAVDFTEKLVVGEELASITSITTASTTIVPSDLLISSQTLNGNQVNVTFINGTDGITYTVTITVLTNLGNSYTDGFLMEILNFALQVGFYKPTTWTLGIGKRLLKWITQQLSNPGEEVQGLTEVDINAAENFAWAIMLSRLSLLYDPTGWSQSPPIPLFQIWDYLASAYVVRLYALRGPAATDIGIRTANTWAKQAEDLMLSITDPPNENQRGVLINSDGTIQGQRYNYGVPVVRNCSGAVLFPNRIDNESYGLHLAGSVEQFVRQNMMRVALGPA